MRSQIDVRAQVEELGGVAVLTAGTMAKADEKVSAAAIRTSSLVPYTLGQPRPRRDAVSSRKIPRWRRAAQADGGQPERRQRIGTAIRPIRSKR